MRYALLALALAACGSSSDSGLKVAKPLVFERWSPPQPSSYDVFLAAQGPVILMASRISMDAGVTWAPLDARVGTPDRVAIAGSVVSLYAPGIGMARWDLSNGTVLQVAGAPPYTASRTWRQNHATGRLIVFDPVQDSVSVEGISGWTTAELPRPSTTECCPYITDLATNGRTLVTVSGWGVHRSIDGGATWQLALASPVGAGRDLLVLGDGRFALTGGATTYLFTAEGDAAGTLPSLVLGDGAGSVCDDGAIVSAGRVTHDLGVTWQSLVAVGDLQIVVERADCAAGAYWVLMRSASFGYRLLRYDELGGTGVAIGNWDAIAPQAWTTGGPSILRTDDGTFLTAGLAWHDQSSGWTLREMPAETWSSGGMLFGTAGGAFYTSSDAGVTWTALAATGLGATDPEAFARTADGALYVGQLQSQTVGTTDSWESDVWRSTDNGATWSTAYMGVATRPAGKDTVGEAHLFVGITDDGTWIATDAISTDAGATWKPTNAVGDKSLAHLMYDGSLVMQPADVSGQIWRVYADGGAGDLLATWSIEADGQPVAAADLRSVVFDQDGYAYVARGTPHIQIWRSSVPLQHRAM